MSYLVEHIRYTLECDACGRFEKRDLDANDEQKGTAGWGRVSVISHSSFCCPSCLEEIEAVLSKKARADWLAEAAKVANCEHHFEQRGLIRYCTKCGTSPAKR